MISSRCRLYGMEFIFSAISESELMIALISSTVRSIAAYHHLKNIFSNLRRMDYFGPIQTRDMLCRGTKRLTLCTRCTKLATIPHYGYTRKLGIRSCNYKAAPQGISKSHYSGSWRPSHGQGRICHVQRRSPDRYTAYYHDAAQSSIFVKEQQRMIPRT